MSLINVLVAVDGDALAQQIRDGKLSPGSATSPTNLGAWTSSDVYISMIAQHNVIVNDNGQSELEIKANSGDSVRWNLTTFGSNTDNTASLYNGAFNPSTAITPPVGFSPAINNYFPTNALPDSGNLDKFVNHYHVLQSTILQTNVTIQYTLNFVLVDNSNGEVLGYFTWDPFIKVA